MYELENAEGIKRLHHLLSLIFSYDFTPDKRHGIAYSMIQAYTSSAVTWLLSTTSIDFIKPDQF